MSGPYDSNDDLYRYIYHYVPTIWREPIGKNSFAPYISSFDIILINSGVIPEKLKMWYFIEAIESWKKKKQEEIVDDWRTL